MRLKRKLVLAYILSLFIPLIVFAFLTTSLNARVRGFITNEFSFGKEPVPEVHAFERNLVATAKSEPSLIKSTAYLNLLFARYMDISTLTVMHQGQTIYHQEKEISSTMVSQTSSFDIKDHTIIFEHAKVESLSKKLRIIFVERLLISLGIFLASHALFIYFTTKKALPDTQKLIDVANNVSQGHYDFEFDTSRKDEIGDVYKAFDNMKNNLKVYENNRKALIANISHDLKTPIASIKGYVTAIHDGLATSPEKMEKYLNIIYNNTMHLDHLIDDLFLYSKLDVNQVTFNLKPIHLDKFLDYYIDELKLDLEERHIEVSWEMPQLKDSVVQADTLRLRQVLQNLISNSERHFDKNKRVIAIELIENENTLEIKLTDNGKGIDPEKLPHIFERFYRADASRNTSMGSSGLGLAIVQQIMENHNGHVYAESKKGHYTTITLQLPKQGENNASYFNH